MRIYILNVFALSSIFIHLVFNQIKTIFQEYMKRNRLRIIVSIDGGGIRGILPLLVLKHIDQLLKKKQLTNDFSQSIDMIAGTSTGALISSGLVVKKSGQYLHTIDEMLQMYTQRGAQLFNLAKPEGAKSEGLRLLLKRNFKGILLSDINIHYAFVCYDIKQQSTLVFENDNSDFSNFPLSTALAACSAVPGYFPAVTIEDKHVLIDGFMTAKNPAEIAYQRLEKYFPDDDYLFLSFGTGQLEGEMYDDIEKEVDRVDQSLKHLAVKNKKLKYYRFQPQLLTAKPQMDNATPENIKALIADGNAYIRDNTALFNLLFEDWTNSFL